MDLKPAVRSTLEGLTDGSITVVVDHAAENGKLASVNGREITERVLVPGVWTLFQAGHIDQFGNVTASGRALLTS